MPQLIQCSRPDLWTPGGGATYWAASPVLADVQAAIALASPGDTVRVPAGSATWAYRLVITKGILLVGAGIGNTVITSNYAGGYGYTNTNFLIVYEPSDPAANDPFRLSGFEFNVAGKSSWLQLRNWSYTNIVNKIRLDHLKVYGVDNGGSIPFMIYVYGNAYGVVDQCDFAGGYFRWLCPDENWTYLTCDLGSANFLMFEDCTIDLPSHYEIVAYGERSGRYVFRHNTVTDLAGTSYPQFFDMHGNQPTSGPATMGAEIYENILNCPTGVMGQLNDQRGGKVMAFNNRINSTSTVFTKVREEYNDSLNPPANHVISGQPQHVSDSYYWGNTKNGTVAVDPFVDGTVDYGGGVGLVPQEEREFWHQQASFDGTVGVGVGLLSARPATCTVGVGYWATDEEKFYRATATNVWTFYYTPYTYPHPHRGDPVLGD